METLTRVNITIKNDLHKLSVCQIYFQNRSMVAIVSAMKEVFEGEYSWFCITLVRPTLRSEFPD